MAARKKPKQEPDTLVKFKVGGTSYQIDLARLTLGERADAVGHFGVSYDDLIGDQIMLAATYFAMRRKKPTTTWADVESLDMQSFEDSPADPTTPPASDGGTPS